MAMNLEDISVGKVNFVEQHGLWSDAQKEAAERVRTEIEEKKLRTIRVGWGDQHGIVRGKNVMTHDFLHVLRNGQDFQTATLFMDTTNNLFAPMFASGGGIGMAELAGGPDSILVPDPTTFRVLPWVPHTGWVLCDMYFANGERVPFDTRGLLAKAHDALRADGYEYVGGLEVEFYITKLEDPMLKPEQSGWPPEPPQVSVLAHGCQYLTKHRQDEIDPILQILQENLQGLGLPLRTMEDEWGPRPVRVHLRPQDRSGGRGQHTSVQDRGQATLPPGRLSRDVHDAAFPSQFLLQRLAPASIVA